MGQPRRQKSAQVTGTSGSRGEWETSQSLGMQRRDLPLLRWRPTEGPSDSIIWSVAEMSPGEPTRVPSSRNQAFILARVGTSTLICSMIGWRVKANPSGPRGSPDAHRSNCKLSPYPGEGGVGTSSRIPSKQKGQEGGGGAPQTWPHG